MSINHFIDANQNPKLDLYANNIEAKKVSVEEEFDELKFKCQNGDVVNLSSLVDKGIGGYRLTSDGDGSVSWTEGAGSSGVDYNGNDPVAIGKLAIYGATNGKLIKDSALSDTDILNKNGDTMNGNLDLQTNSLLNAGDISIDGNTISSSGFLEFVSGNTERINFKSDSGILSLENNNLGQGVNIELAQFQGTNFNILKNTGNVNFCAEANDKIEFTTDCFGANKRVIIDPVASTTQLRDYNLDMNNNTIDNVSNVDTAILTTDTLSSNNPSIDVLFTDLNMNNGDILGVNTTTSGVINCLTMNSTDVKTNTLRVLSNINMFDNNISNVSSLDVDTIQSGNPSIDVLNNIDMNLSNIERVFNIDTGSISSVQGSIFVNDNMVLNNNNITAINNTQTTALSSTDGITEEIDTNAHLDFDNLYEIRNCLNITTQDINTNTITANAPNTDVKLGTNTDLDLNGNNIVNVGKIDGIENSGGVYSESSGFTITSATLTETNILGQGANSGSLTIPANTFEALNMYSFKASGSLSGGSNDIFTLRLKSLVEDPPNPDTIVEFGEIIVELQDNNLVDVWWDIIADFTIRTIGGSGTAVLVLSGAFRYTNNNDVVRTFGRNIIVNTGFDTTKQNTLQLTYENDATNPATSFTINQGSFTKWY